MKLNDLFLDIDDSNRKLMFFVGNIIIENPLTEIAKDKDHIYIRIDDENEIQLNTFKNKIYMRYMFDIRAYPKESMSELLKLIEDQVFEVMRIPSLNEEISFAVDNDHMITFCVYRIYTYHLFKDKQVLTTYVVGLR